MKTKKRRRKPVQKVSPAPVVPMRMFEGRMRTEQQIAVLQQLLNRKPCWVKV